MEPTRSHVCAAVQPPAVLAGAKQRQLCLGSGHVECATFRAARELLGDPVQGAFEAGLWPRSSPRVMTFDPVRARLAGGITTPQARAGGQALMVGLIVVAFVVLVLARTTVPAASTPGVVSPAPTGAPGAGASPSPSQIATPAPSLATGAPSASSEPAPGGSAAPNLPVGTSYKVKRGDTLTSIAARFGVTVKALRKANGLARDAVIRRGQVLVIPKPEATPAP